MSNDMQRAVQDSWQQRCDVWDRWRRHRDLLEQWLQDNRSREWFQCISFSFFRDSVYIHEPTPAFGPNERKRLISILHEFGLPETLKTAGRVVMFASP